jgi:lysophospholipid acyltransferase (LPLAT)-like uncharacterized protein
MKIKQKIIGFLAFCVSRLLELTLSLKIKMHSNIVPKAPYIYCFWHGKQFMPVMCMHRLGTQKQVALVSASQDGEMLATWLKAIGYKVIRGSSSRKAVSSLKKLLHYAQQGYSLGIAADGPRGPIFEAKSGAIYLAAKTGLKIVPIGTYYHRAFQLKTWDKYQLPMPFSKAIFYLGEPVSVPKEAANQAILLDEYTDRVMHALLESEKKAGEFFKSPPEHL